MNAIESYLAMVMDEDPSLPKNETLAEHRKHCKAKPGNCPFERAVDNTDVIPIYSNPKYGWRLIEKDGKTRIELDEKRERIAFGEKGNGYIRLQKPDVEAWQKNPPEGWKIEPWGVYYKAFPIGGKQDKINQNLDRIWEENARRRQEMKKDFETLPMSQLKKKYSPEEMALYYILGIGE